MVCTTKGTGGSPLSMLYSFYRQRSLVALERTHVASISRRAVIFSRLESLSGLPPLSLVDKLRVTGGRFGS